MCQVARSWMDVGIFQTRLMVRFFFYFYSASQEYFGYTIVEGKGNKLSNAQHVKDTNHCINLAK
jgi:hypothetical protein